MNIFRRKRFESDMDAELRFHIAAYVDDLFRSGVPREEAVRRARLEFGALEATKDECRQAGGFQRIDELRADLRLTLRTLRQNPGFAAIAILSLALGIGANTAVFSLMDVLLIRPLPVAYPDQLALLRLDADRYSFTYPLFRQVQDRNAVFSGIFASTYRRVQVPEGADMLLIQAVYGSGEYFRTLGIAPVIGRIFGPDDDRPGGGADGPVAVISSGLWSRKYGSSPAAIGQTMVVNSVVVTIVGVAPPGFFGTEVGNAPDIWLPLNLARQTGDNAACFDNPDCWFLRVIGRLRPDVSWDKAASNLRVISRPSMEATVKPGMRSDRKAKALARIVEFEPGRSGYSGLRMRVKDPLAVLMALVALVLLIACANMAGLLTARASARWREVGMRLALGAGRGRLVRQFLTESLVLSAAGSAAGLLFSFWSTRLLIGVLSTADNPVRLDLRPDWRVALFTTGTAIAAGILFGIWPALRSTRHGVAGILRERAHQLRASHQRSGFARHLLALQTALSVVLLAAAGLFAGTLVRLATLHPGFDPDHLTIVNVLNSRPPVVGPAAINLFGRLMERARAIPGVESVTALSTMPLTGGGWDDFFAIPGRLDLSEEQRDADINTVGTSFSRTMGIPLLEGREFNAGDTAQSEPVILISENAARRWFPNGGAIGARIRAESSGPQPRRIVGIVGNSKYLDLREALPNTVYIPYTQTTQKGYVALRTAAPISATYAAFRRILHEEAPAMPIGTIKTMRQQIDESLSTERLMAYISVFVGVLALLLTCVGLYGVLAYNVTRRTGEIGIRMALGAQRPSVIWLVVKEAMAHTLAGLAVGVAAVFATSRVVRSMLYDVQPNDPFTIAAAVLLLIAVCAVAAWLPVRRATRLHPIEALREE